MHEFKDNSDLIEQIPDPETVNLLLAESIRRSVLLRSLLRVARLREKYPRPTNDRAPLQEIAHANSR